MNLIEFDKERVIETIINFTILFGDQLIFGNGQAPLFEEIAGEIFVAVDGLAHNAGAGVGNFKKLKGGGDGGTQMFLTIDGIDQIEDKIGFIFFKVFSNIAVTGEKHCFDVHFIEIRGDDFGATFDFGFGDVLLLGREIFPFGIGIKNGDTFGNW